MKFRLFVILSYITLLIIVCLNRQTMRMSSGSGRRAGRGSGRMTYGAPDGGLTSNNDQATTNTRPSTLYEALLQLKVRYTDY